ncbi:MAG: hypothetical protein AAF700_01230 [Pseudomonadota bacterium]
MRRLPKSFTNLKHKEAGALASLVLAFGLTASASAQDITVLVQRDVDWTELYFSAEATTLFDVFDVAPETFSGHQDQVDFGIFRRGTAWIGDLFLSEATVTIRASDADFEAMSFMAHPMEDKLPMSTPLEALIAIGVCNGPEDGTLVSLSDLQGYVGFFSDVASDGEPIRISLPQSWEGTLDVRVLDFDSDGNLLEQDVVLPEGEDLILDHTDANRPWLSEIFTQLWR